MLRAIPASLAFLTGPGGVAGAGHLALPGVTAGWLGHHLRAEGLRADDLQQIRREFIGVPATYAGRVVGRVRKAHLGRRGRRSVLGSVELFDRALGERLAREGCLAAAWLDVDVYRSDVRQRLNGARFTDVVVPRGVRYIEILPKGKRPYVVLDPKTYELFLARDAA